MRDLPRSIAPWPLFLALAMLVPPTGGCGSGGGDMTAATEAPFGFSDADLRLNTMPAEVELDGMRICCSGANVYAVWTDDRDGDEVVYFNRSRDGGRTWLAADVRISDVTGRPSEDANLCCDGERVYVVWEDHRAGQADMYVNVSHDGGDTWLATNRRIRTAPAGVDAARKPRICCSGLTVTVAWQDNHGAGPIGGIYVNRSLDGGATWLGADVPIHPEYTEFEICCDGLNVYAVIEDDSVRNDILFRRSADGGATWFPGVRLDQDSIMGGVSYAAEICCAGDRVYVVWEDAGAAAPSDIHFNTSHDGGVTWLPAQARLDTDTPRASSSKRPQICCAGDRVYVVWTDFRDGLDQLRFRRSWDAGLTWLGDDVRIDGQPTADCPLICCDGDHVFVAWYLSGPLGDAVVMDYSLDAGTTWLSSDLRVDTGPGLTVEPAGICCGAGAVHVLWRDDRTGMEEAWVRTARVR